MTKILLTRHGHVDGIKPERFRGRSPLDLTARGRAEASALAQRIATGWRLKAIAEPIIVCTHATSTEDILKPKHIPASDLTPCEELGATLAAGMALGIF